MTRELINPEIFENVVAWANDRNIINGSDSKQQCLKLFEEGGELASAIVKRHRKKTKDAIGDCLVVLQIISEIEGFSLNECLEHSWNEIKDRKGKMIDGIFVKEADIIHSANPLP